MLFSVIIPTYNRVEYLRATLDSVRQQTFKDFEVIVVDDGSTDGTAAYVSSLEGTVSFIQQTNAGPAAARNRGAEVARGTYLAFLDSDDLWFPWTLENAASVTNAVENPAIVSGPLFPFTDTSELKGIVPVPVAYQTYPNYLLSSRDLHFVGSCAMVVRRDSFLSVGGFLKENMHGEDHDLTLRLGTSGKFVMIQAPAYVAYRRHDANMTMSLQKTVKGVERLLNQECKGAYPGGNSHRRNRQQILGSHVRPVAVACARSGLQSDAWDLYRRTFFWHMALFRLKFLLGFPLTSLWSVLSRSDDAAQKASNDSPPKH